MQRPGKTKSSNEFVEMPMYLRCIYKAESIELRDRLDVRDKGEGDAKNDSQVLGRCCWVDGETVLRGRKHSRNMFARGGGERE